MCYNEINIIKIQRWFRKCILRLKRLPLIMYKIQSYLRLQSFIFSNYHKDGRINSSVYEDEIIELLISKFDIRIKKPDIRMWYDVLAYDYIYGWIPINIKITTTLTPDNAGNLAMCVYAYTDEILSLHNKYNNKKLSNILYTKLKNKQYNYSKKDYYFIVINKNNTDDIIINSIKGLMNITSNSNNLPFQVCWNKNRVFIYENINKKIKIFIDCLKNTKQNWKEEFLKNMNTL